jgi:ketosteroid isomerase-like protein
MNGSAGDTERLAVEAILDREVAAIANDDIAGYLAILDDEAMFLPPNLEPKQGEDLREWLRDFLRRFAVAWLSYTHEETEVAGDIAYHRFAYSWKVTPKSGGEPVVGHGKGLHILRRRAGQDWKLWREIWNASPAR